MSITTDFTTAVAYADKLSSLARANPVTDEDLDLESRQIGKNIGGTEFLKQGKREVFEKHRNLEKLGISEIGDTRTSQKIMIYAKNKTYEKIWGIEEFRKNSKNMIIGGGHLRNSGKPDIPENHDIREKRGRMQISSAPRSSRRIRKKN